MSDIIKQTIYDGEYAVFPLKENNVEYVLESAMYHMGTNKMVSNSINYFATGDKIEGVFSGKSVVYKLDLRDINDIMSAEEFPTDRDNVLIVSVEPGYYAKLTLDVVCKNHEEPIDSKTMAEIRHETAINQIMNGTEIGTWYYSFKDEQRKVEFHDNGLATVVRRGSDDSPYVVELEDHRHYAIYSEIYNRHNELRKYYREIFTGENMITEMERLPHHYPVNYTAYITPKGIDMPKGKSKRSKETLTIFVPDKSTAMIRLVDLGPYEYNDIDLLRWQAGYELGDKLYYDGDRTHIQNIRLTGGYSIMNGILMIDVSDYHDLIVTECSTDEYLCTVLNTVINPNNPIIDERCFADCTIKDIKTDENGIHPGTYLIMNIDANAMNTHTIYDINIYGIPNKQEEEKQDEPSQTTKDLDYLCKLFEKNKKNLDPDSEKRAEKVIDILNTYADPKSSMTKKEALVKSLMAWLYCGPDNE